MKTGVVLMLLLLALPSVVFTEESPVITMRSNEQNGFVRMVFESQNQDVISSASVNESYSLVKIDFPHEFTFKQGTLPGSVKLSIKENSIYLNIATLEKIRVTRLQAPSRLVVDAYITGGVTEGENTPPPPPVVHAPGKPFRLYVLMIDPGHGGADTGIVFEQSRESAITLNVAQGLAKQASSHVKNVMLSRKDDSFMSIEQRIAEIGKSHADVLISLHVTRSPYFGIFKSSIPPYATAKTARYSTSFAQAEFVERSHVLAQSIGVALHDQFKIDARQIELPMPLLMAMGMPSVAIELPAPSAFNYTPENIALLSEAILKGIAEYAER
ncbi:MAG: N-acetylmuramoyl-L-alanine amidase [Nitrospirae bacterium]|nr:N-acetylmuramoyl-L-alanine amidase [Nitrospirota bacterium]